MSASTASQHLPAAGSARSRRRTTTSRSHPAHMHLTRRGRLLVLLALVGVLFAAFSLGRSASQASPRVDAAPARLQPAVEQLTVQSGESLWTLARRVAPERDPREVIAQIRTLNELTTTQLRPGQQLLLPLPA
jgi:LysM repeat protein